VNTTNNEVRIAPDQFTNLIEALTSDSDKLSIIVQNANDEAVARAHGDAENRAMIEYLGAELRTVQETLESIYAYIVREEGVE
jgi:hypothetical protein